MFLWKWSYYRLCAQLERNTSNFATFLGACFLSDACQFFFLSFWYLLGIYLCCNCWRVNIHYLLMNLFVWLISFSKYFFFWLVFFCFTISPLFRNRKKGPSVTGSRGWLNIGFWRYRLHFSHRLIYFCYLSWLKHFIFFAIEASMVKQILFLWCMLGFGTPYSHFFCFFLDQYFNIDGIGLYKFQ